MKIIRVQKQGQIALPIEFRKELDIKTGSYIAAELEDKAIVIRRAEIETPDILE